MANNPDSEAKFLFELLDSDFDLSVVSFSVEKVNTIKKKNSFNATWLMKRVDEINL